MEWYARAILAGACLSSRSQLEICRDYLRCFHSKSKGDSGRSSASGPRGHALPEEKGNLGIAMTPEAERCLRNAGLRSRRGKDYSDRSSVLRFPPGRAGPMRANWRERSTPLRPRGGEGLRPGLRRRMLMPTPQVHECRTWEPVQDRPYVFRICCASLRMVLPLVQGGLRRMLTRKEL